MNTPSILFIERNIFETQFVAIGYEFVHTFREPNAVNVSIAITKTQLILSLLESQAKFSFLVFMSKYVNKLYF